MNLTLIFVSKYKKFSLNWEHEHCEFCTSKISEYEGDLHKGYNTENIKIGLKRLNEEKVFAKARSMAN